MIIITNKVSTKKYYKVFFVRLTNEPNDIKRGDDIFNFIYKYSYNWLWMLTSIGIIETSYKKNQKASKTYFGKCK